MAEVLLSVGTEQLLKMVIGKATDEIGSVLGVKKDVENLKDILRRIQMVLQHAEKKQVDDVNVMLWLKDLKDVAYEADDVLDEIAYEGLRRKIEIQNRIKNKVCDFFTPLNPIAFRFKIAHKIKDINRKLGEIDRNRERFRLDQVHVVSNGPVILDRETTSFVDDSEVFGREDDKSRIIDMLLQASSGDDVFSVIPILGLGGLGKTTLAQLVYNDVRVKTHFSMKIWVCVSNDNDKRKLFEKMIESISSKRCEVSSVDVMLRNLRDKLDEKKFLLVLDDMWWDENQFSETWDTLKGLLKCAAQGSKIMVTTRSSEVVSIVGGTFPTYGLHTLQDDDCWRLFESRAFGNGGAERTQALEAIGREIVKKCAGVPLPIKTLGSLMRAKKEKDEWLAVKSSEIWNVSDVNKKIISVLKLSYDNLDSPSKRCFLYCSIFYKDFTIRKKTLVRLWMAEGLLELSTGSEMMEDIGNKCFNTLCKNSLFQEVNKNKFGEVESCKMHDLVHDLAQSIARTECSFVIANMMPKDVSEIRYMAYDSGRTKEFAERLYEARKLRTLFTYNIYKVGKEVSDDMFLNFKSLRVLDLGFTGIKKFPSSICKLKHLRFLDLSMTDIEELPKSITCLYNLQTLILTDCQKLKRLPEGLGKLINLRHLEIDLSREWSEIPKGIGRLSCLQTLPIFLVEGKDDGRGITELEHLNLLRGRLSIYQLENVKDVKFAKVANLKGKKNIDSLGLEWGRDDTDNINDYLILDALQPDSNLKELWIRGFGGTKFPSWINSGTSLVEIYFYSCNKCEYLPSFGKLPSLKKFYINGMSNLKRLGDAHDDCTGNTNVQVVKEEMEEARRSTTTLLAFPSLESLSLRKMPNLEEWLEPKLNSFPRLNALYIEDCPELKVMPSSFPSLRTLEFSPESNDIAIRSIMTNATNLNRLCIDGFSNLKFLPEELLHKNKFLDNLIIKNCPEFEGFLGNHNGNEEVGPPTLEVLYVADCPKLSMIPTSLPSLKALGISNSNHMLVGSLTSKLTSLTYLWVEDIADLSSLPRDLLQNNKLLDYLAIVNCPRLRDDFLPNKGEELQLFMSFTKFVVRGCSNLTSINLQGFKSLRYLEITNCRGLKSFPKDLPFFPHLEQMRIGRISEELDYFPFPEVAEHHFVSLHKLGIVGSPELKSLPHQLQHLKALKNLTIDNFDSLTTLPDWLGNIQSLRELFIWNCKNLRNFPPEEVMRRLTLLKLLEIKNCPLLKERCNEESCNEELSTIPHIQTIKIDGCFVKDLS